MNRRARTLLHRRSSLQTIARCALVGALALFVGGELAADIVRLNNGRTLEGKVRDTGGETIEILLPYGSLGIPRDLVASVERADTVADLVAARLAELDADDAEGLYELAIYCREESAYTLAGRLLEEVLAVDPEHAAARRGLGFVRDGGEWVSEEELRRRRGEVVFRGVWMPAAERDRLLALEAAITAERIGSELERARLEVELARLEAELERRAEPRREGIPLYPAYGPLVYPPGHIGPDHRGVMRREAHAGDAVERQLERRRVERVRRAPPAAPTDPGPRHRRGRFLEPEG